jgi:hypothetical protein
MGENVLRVCLAVAIGVAVVGIAAFLAPRKLHEDPVCEVTPRVLDAEPKFYDGKLVRIKTQGMESTNDPREFIYRKQSDQGPVVVCYFRDPCAHLPETITGRCIGPRNGVVTVIDCRP